VRRRVAGECERIIEQGRISVNGKVVTRLGTKVDPAVDALAFDSERVKPEETVYFLVTKPKRSSLASSIS